MAFTVPIVNFAKGEVAPSLYGRVDVQQYSAALKKARNWIVLKTGGVTFRPGTRLVGKVDDPTKPIRLAPFQFSIDQAYALVLGQGSMRPMALGGFVLEQNTKITAITQANPAVLTVAYHGYSAGDRIYLSGIQGMTEMNNRFAVVTAVPDANTFAVDIDSSSYAAFVSSDGAINVNPPTPPPTDPVIPPVVPPVTPPTTGGGGGTYIPPRRCVAANSTLIRMANFLRNGPGPAKLARYVRAGEWVWTQHEDTMEWGAFRIEAVEIAEEPVFASPTLPDATERHRFWMDGWKFAGALGKPSGRADVWKASVEGARTYMSRHVESKRWVLSHNIKQTDPIEGSL